MDWLIAGISFVAAFIFALGGVGGAIILVPIMISLGIPVNTAKPIGLFYNTISLSGASVYNIRQKRLDWRAGLPIIVSSLVFAVVGAYASKFIPVRIVLIVFIAFLLFASGMFLFYKKKGRETYRDDVPYFSLTLVGSFAGFLSGLLGIGGGNIIAPLMLMLGFDPKKVTAITAFVVPFSSFTGFLTYWMMGNIDWKITLIASVSGLVGAILGTRFMHNRLQAKTVKKILAIILIIMATKLIIKII